MPEVTAPVGAKWLERSSRRSGEWRPSLRPRSSISRDSSRADRSLRRDPLLQDRRVAGPRRLGAGKGGRGLRLDLETGRKPRKSTASAATVAVVERDPADVRANSASRQRQRRLALFEVTEACYAGSMIAVKRFLPDTLKMVGPREDSLPAVAHARTGRQVRAIFAALETRRRRTRPVENATQ
jgi:hypothetical protein